MEIISPRGACCFDPGQTLTQCETCIRTLRIAQFRPVPAVAGHASASHYGHSRLRELVLGGVSRHLFDHMTIPVFMAH
jgi:hypothetical protein